MVDLGGSLAVASRGLFATGVSTDLNGIFPQLLNPFPGLPFLPLLFESSREETGDGKAQD